jgi:formamidopyrimidine-DNA glycosylase
MPELPDITIYLEALERRVMGQTLKQVRIASPFLLRTAVPPLQRVHGRKVIKLRRLGKRIVFGFDDDFWLVLHLMIAGRLHWREVHTANVPGTRSLSPSSGEKATARRLKGLANIEAAFDFSNGTLFLTEAGTKKRASLHLVQCADSLSAHDPGGMEVLAVALDAFAQALTRRNHTLKRALTDPRLFSGIGNAYSDEILHRARLSPVTLTQKLSPGEIARLHRATQETLRHWIELLRQETGDRFPENVTAFRPEMAVHGKFGKPCPACGTKVQRIRYADNETNYCPSCQTGGRLLADRSLSLLLKKDWPKTLEELEEIQTRRVGETHRSTHAKPATTPTSEPRSRSHVR